MKILNSLFNWVSGKDTALVTTQDLYRSRYIFLYQHRRSKRSYREYLEDTTINRINFYLQEEFPKNIKKEVKSEIVDCTVCFLKYIMVNYDYFPGGEIFENEFNKIIVHNVNKLKT